MAPELLAIEEVEDEDGDTNLEIVKSFDANEDLVPTILEFTDGLLKQI